MGITNDLFRNEVAPGIDPETLKLCDLIPDPEDRRDPLTGLRGIDAFEAFLKVLAPIERATFDDIALDQTVLNRTAPGEKIGTVTSANRALSNPQGLSRCAADCPSIFSRRPAPGAAGQTTAVRNSPPPRPHRPREPSPPRRNHLRRHRMHPLSYPHPVHRARHQPGIRPPPGSALFRSAAARHSHRRRHPASRRPGKRDPHASALGTALPPPLPPRRLRRHPARGHPPPRQRSPNRYHQLPRTPHPRPSRPASLSRFALIRRSWRVSLARQPRLVGWVSGQAARPRSSVNACRLGRI